MKEENDKCIFEILTGTYEEYLLGYKFLQDVEEKYVLEHTFANHSHKASLRAVAAYGSCLASGGVDENIHLYDLLTRRESGILTHHSGTITSLCFTPDGTHLISGSDDGAIAIVRVGNWVLEKIWTKAHKGSAVVSVAVHPTGKLALSIGADKTIRSWNLIRGRPAYTVNLASKFKRLEIVSWSVCGAYFALASENSLDIYSVDSCSVDRNIRTKDKIISLQFIEGQKICIGDWAGNVICYSFILGDEIWRIKQTQGMRVKALAVESSWLVAVNSSGKISVYNLNKDKPELIVEKDTSCRITCLAISCQPSSGDHYVSKKKKRKIQPRIQDHEIKQEAKVKKLTTSWCPAGQKWEVTNQF